MDSLTAGVLAPHARVGQTDHAGDIISTALVATLFGAQLAAQCHRHLRGELPAKGPMSSALITPAYSAVRAERPASRPRGSPAGQQHLRCGVVEAKLRAEYRCGPAAGRRCGRVNGEQSRFQAGAYETGYGEVSWGGHFAMRDRTSKRPADGRIEHGDEQSASWGAVPDEECVAQCRNVSAPDNGMRAGAGWGWSPWGAVARVGLSCA